MKFNIESEKNNVYLKRKELVVKIDHTSESTPSMASLQQLMAKETKKEVEQIEVKDIFSEKGRAHAKSRVFVWDEKRVQDLSKVVKKETKTEEAKAPVADAKAAPEKK